jgi:hypothetical protein
MFHIRHKAVAGQKIPDERIGSCDRALDDLPARQTYEMQVLGMVGQMIGRRTVVEMGVGDHAHLLEGLEVAVDRGEGKWRSAVLTDGRGEAVGCRVSERPHSLDDPLPLRGQSHAPGPQ